MKTRIYYCLVFFWLFASGIFSASNAAVFMRTAPPSQRVVARPATAHKNAVWASGHWGVRNGSYIWVGGKWHKQRPGFRWTDGHWKKTARGWIWVKGRWVRK